MADTSLVVVSGNSVVASERKIIAPDAAAIEQARRILADARKAGVKIGPAKADSVPVKQRIATGGDSWMQFGHKVNTDLVSLVDQGMPLAFKVGLSPVETHNPFSGEAVNVDSRFAIFRNDRDMPLGFVGNRYLPLQNAEILEVGKAILDNVDGAIVDRCLIFDNGVTCALSVRLPGDMQFAGDDSPTQRYLLLVWGHSGLRAVKFLVTAVRVVCKNTLALALHKDGENAITIKHTANAAEKLEIAKLNVRLAHQRFDEFATMMDALANKRFTLPQMEDFAKQLLGEGDATRTKNNRDALVDLFRGGVDHTRENAYFALQAATQYADHGMGTRVVEGEDNREEKRARSVLMGSSAAFKQTALDYLLSA